MRELDLRMPVPATMKQLFDGIPFDELPVAHIKATKNNTIINVRDKHVSIVDEYNRIAFFLHLECQRSLYVRSS